VVTARTAAGRIGRLVSCVVERSSCRRIMLRQKDLAISKALSALSVSPAVVRELGMALSCTKKRPLLPAGIRGTTSGGRARASQRPSGQLAGKRKTNELASSDENFEAPNRRPAPDNGSTPLPARPTTVKGRTSCNLQPATRVQRGRGDSRGCFGRPRRPVSAKWAAHAHSHGFRPVRTRCLVRDSK
jgi:hypothetical protein